jgi:hypothetical protein
LKNKSLKDSANAALTASVVKENISTIAQDIAQIALDTALDEGLLKEIPIVSWFFRAGAIGRGIRDRLFLKKLASFLREASRISPEGRGAFAKRLADEPEFAERCGESALMLIDKLSSSSKSRLMGFTLRRFAEGAIDEVILSRIYAALEFISLWRLLDLPKYYFEDGLGSLGQDAAALYQQLGLIAIYYGDKDERLHCDFRTGSSDLMSYHQPFYRETDIGTSVAEVVRDYLNEPD